MSVWVSRSCTRTTRVVCLVVITALVPVFALAGDIASGKQMPTLKASAAQIVARDVAAAPARPAPARKDQQGSTSTSSTSFFKTRPGMIALSVMAVGTGYALYSASHDRIHSAGKK
jgi:hypothetical protein